MTARDSGLTRLLAIRTVALRTASRDLNRAIETASGIRVLANRIDALRLELTPVVSQSTGARLKASLATRTGLTLAAARQGARRDIADALQAEATLAVHRDRTAAEAVERAIERHKAGQAEAVARSISDDQPARRLAR